MKKWVLSILVFLVTLAILTFFGFFLVIFLAGPHSDILPEYLAAPVFFTVLFFVLAVPSWLAFKTFKFFDKNKLS
jgi:hypothetical protein